MPDIEDGVIDSTASDSQDLALLDAEENDSQPERFEDESKVKPQEEEAPKEEGKEEAKEEPKEEEEEKDEKAKPFPYDRPTMQQLREAFPDLFKKFPVLRDIYYREAEFSQIYPTVEDAKEAASQAESFEALSNKIFNQDTEGLLSAVKEADERAFNAMADNVLSAIYKMSPDAHWRATLPLLQNLVRGFYAEGKRRNNENIVNSAEYLSDFVFGDIKVARGEKNLIAPATPEITEERKQLEADRAKFAVDRFEGFSSSVSTDADKSLRSFVDEKKKIDPDGVFTDFIRETIVGKVLQEVDKQLVADKIHMKYMNSLWNKARDAGYNDEWKSRIISAYLARAKSLVPAIRAKFVSEARGSSARAAERNEEVREKVASRKSPQGGRTSSENRNGPIDPKKVDWDKTSDLDLIEDRVTYR